MTDQDEQQMPPQTLRILFGRRWVRPDELAGMDVGSVIDLAVPAEDDVTVCARGSCVVTGRAVSVGGRLAVRLADVTGAADEQDNTDKK